MKKTILLIGIILFCGLAFPQNTGYMGNHFIFNAEGSLSPSWIRPNPLSAALNEHIESKAARRYLGLNYWLSPNIEVIVWRKGTVGAGYNYYNSPFSGEITRYFLQTGSSNVYFSEGYAFTGRVVAHGFNVFYKQYFGDTRAPMGWYGKFTFDGYFYRYGCAEELPQYIEHFDTHPEEVVGTDYVAVGKDGTGSAFGLKAEIGYDYVFFNRLRLSMGVSFGTTFSGYKCLNKKLKEEWSYDDAGKTSLSVNDFVATRILSAYWFGIKIGIGVIAF